MRWTFRVPDDVIAASFAHVSFTQQQLHAALREFGPRILKGKSLQATWDVENPTRNTCYFVSETVYWYCAPAGSYAMALEVPGDPFMHRFVEWPDGSVVDVTCDQFDDYRLLDYSKAFRKPFMQTGSAGPSVRAQRLAGALGLVLAAGRVCA